jgi:hypothetical protein
MRALVLAAVLSALATAPALACAHSGMKIPAAGQSLDAYLPEATLSQADRAIVQALRLKITTLLSEGNIQAANATEEQAMAMLGYRKAWLRCGPGTFSWMKIPTVG